MISIQGLSFRFGASPRYALRNVNLEIAASEFVVITGPSGCGKSTLALAIGGYLFRQYDGETAGTVTVAGMDVRGVPIYDIAEVVGLVQQNPEDQFCTLTVQDEVAFGLENRCLPPDEIRQRMAWALEVVGASHLVGRALATLSGGEKQKVAIAAVMAARPQVLIFDEPTSNLDPTATAEIFRVISHIRARAGLTVLVIEHKVEVLRQFAPRLVALDGGRVVYDGPMSAGERVSESANRQVSESANQDSEQATHYGTRLTEHAPRNTPHASRATNHGSRTTHPPTPPAVRVDDLHVGYDDVPILHGVSLEVGEGEFVALMGDNGTGKTTFLHSLLGFLKPGRGRIEVLGHDMHRVSTSRLVRQVGFVFQNPDHQLFADGVWQEATLAARNFDTLDEATQARARDLLARCGLGDRQQDHPYRLSYGEKRRLNLVSVLVHDPRLILLDEILIGQDAGNAAMLLDLLCEQVRQGGTVIMVNHHPDVTSRYASRLVFFNDGKIIVDAPTADAFRQLAHLGLQAYLPNDHATRITNHVS